MSSQAETIPPSAPGEVVYASAFFRDDSSFVNALQQRRRTAQAILVQENAEQVSGWLQRVLGPGVDLRPIAEETFRQALKRGPTNNASSVTLNDWLLGIAVGIAVKHLRRQRWSGLLNLLRGNVRKGAAPAESAGQRTGETTDVSAVGQSVAAQVAMQRIYTVLETMPIIQRVVFTLRFFAQLELVDIANACDISVSRARTHLARSRYAFATRVQDDPALETVLQGWARAS